jgi:AhpD family alkylhydroperoxidase
MTTRLPPVPETERTPEMTEFFEGFRSGVASGGPEKERASGSNLLGTLARYPTLARAFLGFNTHLLRGTSLSGRLRELLVLRVAAIRRSDYEWAQHVILARKFGITDDELARISDAPHSPEWSATERAVLSSVDELLDDGMIADATWQILAGELDDRQLMDLVFTVGAYAMLGMALRSFGVEPEEELLPHLPVRSDSSAGNPTSRK